MTKKRKTDFRGKVGSNIRKREKESSFGYLDLPKGIKAYKAPEGARSVLLDIIPYIVSDMYHPDRDDVNALPGDPWYTRPFKTHGNIGVDRKSYVCPRSIGERCPICDHFDKSEEEWEVKKNYQPVNRHLFCVIPIDSDEHDETPYIWDMADFLFFDQLADLVKEDESRESFPNLEDGLTLEVKFKWRKFGKYPYPDTRDIEFHEREEAYDESILDEIPCLDDLLIVKSFDELKNIFYAIDEEEGREEITDEEPEEEKTHKASSFRKKKTLKKEEEEPEDEEPEEEKKPTMTREKKPEKKEDNSDEKCPHGHRFGKDCEKFKECEECDLWDDCYEEMNK